MRAILLPGYNGEASQPILVKLEQRLAPLGIACARRELKKGKPSEGLALEMAQLESWLTEEANRSPRAGATALTGLALDAPLQTALVGRSFGGRVCARYAAVHPVAAVVLLGFPLRPPGKRRPEDAAALAALTCPTLIVQGDDDELGPLSAFRPLLRKNRALSLHVVKGAGHSFGRHEAAALEAAAAWLQAKERRSAMAE